LTFHRIAFFNNRTLILHCQGEDKPFFELGEAANGPAHEPPAGGRRAFQSKVILLAGLLHLPEG
jgi:hypothetical protein